MSDSEREILKRYYTENDFFLSVSGVLKVLSVPASIAAAAVWLAASACGSGGAAAAAVAAAAQALLCAFALCDAPTRAPQAFFYTDLVVSSVSGVVLVAWAVLALVLCSPSAPLEYVHAPLALTAAALLVGGAVAAYFAAAAAGGAGAAAAGPAPGDARAEPSAAQRELEV